MNLPHFVYLEIWGIRLYTAHQVPLQCAWLGLRFIPLSIHKLALELLFAVVATHAKICTVPGIILVVEKGSGGAVLQCFIMELVLAKVKFSRSGWNS